MRKTGDHIVLESGLNWLNGNKSVLFAKEVQETIATTGASGPGGEDREWSSEHLLLAALASGYTAGFLRAAEKTGLPVHFGCDAVGTMERNSGPWRFWQIDIYPRIVVRTEADRAAAAGADIAARAACPVYHLLNTDVIFHTNIIVEPKRNSGT